MDAVKRETQVSEEISSQDLLLEQLFKEINLLEERIQPVLVPNYPEEPDVKGNNTAEPIVPLAQVLSTSNSRIRKAIRSIEKLRTRIEL